MEAKRLSPEEIGRQSEWMRRVRLLNEESAASGCEPSDEGLKKAMVVTYGCQQNVSDSEKIKGMLAEMGYGFTDDAETADLVVFNTCAVRGHAEDRAIGNIGALKPVKLRHPGMVIAVCGCMMQEKHEVERIRAEYHHVDLVFGTGMLYRFPELLYQVLSGKARVFDVDGEENVLAEGLPLRRDGKIKAWLPVSYGCNNFCSYCIVPYVRGRERSRTPDDVLREAEEIIAAGYRDITLLGQNVNSYGNDADFGWSFARLLRAINDMPGDFRLRFMTSHPKDMSQELLETIAQCEKVSKHIHLPFQAGSNRVLAAMNRRYTREAYLKLAQRAKETIPGVSLTSDVIVGFPGETYDEFRQTLDVVAQVKFDGLFTFIYSPRKGTPAASMEDPVPHGEKTRWFAELLALQDNITREKLAKCVGKTFRVLCEGAGKTGLGFMTGRNDAGTIVDFPGPPELEGKFLNVEITQSQKFMLLGQRK